MRLMKKYAQSLKNIIITLKLKKVFLTLFVKALREGELSRIASCSLFHSMQVTTENVFSPSLSRAYYSS